VSELDDPLWTELRALVARFDSVPAAVTAAAKATLAWRDPDAALARLVADSADTGLVGVRGLGQPRLVTFEADGVTIEVEVGHVDRRVRLVGQVVPPGPGEVRVDGDGGERSETTVDALGRFTVHSDATGSIRLAWKAAGTETLVITAWFLP
jgi:hypothetical protein